MAIARLNLIASLDPEWYTQIVEFVQDNPEFNVLLSFTSLTRYPMGFNKNPGETYDPYAPSNIFETIIYCIAASGVKMTYGYAQYKQIITYLRESNYFEKDMVFPFKIQPKKVQIYKDLINILLENSIIISKMSISDLEIVKQVKGIGVTTISLCEQLFGDMQTVPYSDRGFIKGFGKLYKIDKPTKKQMIETTNKWRNKKVGTMFIYQCYYYY